ncbi:hypothetical protein TRIATDRAFT_281841 [Trichoderma atroviride IMI 206040]|uniref:Uncharacterized protein n=1 Tax=Hypocrea atroviridis (strain ATCC 20476 / IMI 206040) TaxID=452589 RepID=G9NML5_HYPAI|nr:uncharacterized protein TRIATDRAFT_281841 [Trichoderma atroviride IMI 206040]EHK48145.1 hypothetical protein TRIATDRAFT_281841 [Trichoderma atroviride IMI 206040]
MQLGQVACTGLGEDITGSSDGKMAINKQSDQVSNSVVDTEHSGRDWTEQKERQRVNRALEGGIGSSHLRPECNLALSPSPRAHTLKLAATVALRLNNVAAQESAAQHPQRRQRLNRFKVGWIDGYWTRAQRSLSASWLGQTAGAQILVAVADLIMVHDWKISQVPIARALGPARSLPGLLVLLEANDQSRSGLERAEAAVSKSG